MTEEKHIYDWLQLICLIILFFNRSRLFPTLSTAVVEQSHEVVKWSLLGGVQVFSSTKSQ